VVFCHGEVSYEEVEVQRRVATALGTDSVELREFWGSTLYHPDDLPFSIGATPTSYSATPLPPAPCMTCSQGRRLCCCAGKARRVGTKPDRKQNLF
jgi:hypothetical protein